MGNFWSKKLRGSLLDVVEEALKEDPTDAVELYAELAIVRQTSLDITLMYEAALSDPEKAKALPALGAAVRECMDDIGRMVKLIADLEEKRADKLSVHNIHYVVNQIVRIAHETFGGDEQLGEVFRKAVIDKLKVESKGTTLTPDQDAEAMDATVPAAPTTP